MKPNKRIVKAKSKLRSQPIDWVFIPKASPTGTTVVARLFDKGNIKRGGMK